MIFIKPSDAVLTGPLYLWKFTKSTSKTFDEMENNTNGEIHCSNRGNLHITVRKIDDNLYATYDTDSALGMITLGQSFHPLNIQPTYNTYYMIIQLLSELITVYKGIPLERVVRWHPLINDFCRDVRGFYNTAVASLTSGQDIMSNEIEIRWAGRPYFIDGRRNLRAADGTIIANLNP